MNTEAISEFYDWFSKSKAHATQSGYHKLLVHYYRFFIPDGASILEIGCGTGDLLAALNPSRGVGVDFSQGMLDVAVARHPHLRFGFQAAETLHLDEEPFDYIVFSDTLTFLDDIREALVRIKPLCHARTRIIFNFFSQLWRPIIWTLEKLSLRTAQPLPNWVTVGDLENILQISGFELVTSDSRIVFPALIPFLSPLFNRWLMILPLYRHLSLANFVVARMPHALVASESPNGVSVVCPCRNERENIAEIVRRLPNFEIPSELIFVEGNSNDDTLMECCRVRDACPNRDISVITQLGSGKGDAVRQGFAASKYDVLVILDADMTVAPEELPGFVLALVSGRAEFINGSRLVYPMQNEAMRFLNLIGNKFFAVAFSWLLGQSIKDTLCGTKVLLKSDYEKLARQRHYFGVLDPFGDFDLIFGATKLGLKLRDFPIHYRARSHGETKIHRFRHGWLLLKMCALAILKLKWR